MVDAEGYDGQQPPDKVVTVPVPPGDFADSIADAPAPAPGLRKRGFLATRGEAAVAGIGETVARLEKRRHEIALKIPSEGARDIFLKSSARLAAESYQQVRAHVAAQVRVAEEDSLKANLAETLRSVAMDPANETRAAEMIAATAGAAISMATSPEDAQAKVDAIRADVASTRAKALIAGKQLEAAERVVNGSRHALGEKATPLDKEIRLEREGLQAEGLAQALVGGAMRPDGSVNDRKALDGLDTLPLDMVEKVRPRLHERLTEAQATFKEETQRIAVKAYAAYNTGGWSGIPEGLKEQLNQRDPPLYDKLKNEAMERRARTAGVQAAINKEAQNDLLTMPDNERASVDLTAFLARHPDVDKLGASSLGPIQQAAKNRIAKGQATRQAEFITQAKANAQGFVKEKSAQRELEAEAALAYDAFQLEHERPPNADEAAKLIGALVVKQSTKPGALWGTNPEFEFQRRARERHEAAKAVKFEVVGPGGARGMATEAWLTAHPDWRRK